jgi:hypothetical protein
LNALAPGKIKAKVSTSAKRHEVNFQSAFKQMADSIPKRTTSLKRGQATESVEEAISGEEMIEDDF